MKRNDKDEDGDANDDYDDDEQQWRISEDWFYLMFKNCTFRISLLKVEDAKK